MMIQKEIRIINDREVHLFFDTEQQVYLVASDAMEIFLKSIQELKRFTDMAEQELLHFLPCKVGDYVYQIDRMNNKINTKKVRQITIILGRQSCIIQFDFETTGYCIYEEFGRTVFTNKVDAMNALNAKTEVKE